MLKRYQYYHDDGIDIAAARERVNVLQWFLDSDFMIVYTTEAVDTAAFLVMSMC